MTGLQQAVEDYLATRRALGFKLAEHERPLRDFAAALEQDGLSTITIDAAVAWAVRPTVADPSWWATRLAMVRGFARWLSAYDPATEVPPADLMPRHSRRADPYPYTDEDIVGLLRAARTLRQPLRAATYETLIGLLAVTGMRVGEAIALDRDDVDWDNGLLVVRHSKFDKSREVVLHATTIDALCSYAKTRDRALRASSSPALLLSLAGTRLIYKNVQHVFHQLVHQVGLAPHSDRCRPRIHDLRHRFAVTTLLGWYRDGDNVEVRLPQLSTYLGHIDPAATYWYLRAAPELLALAAARLENAQKATR